MADPQRMTLDVDGRHHVVTIEQHAVRRTITWTHDDVVVATKSSAEESLGLGPDEGHEDAGRLELRFTALGRPKRVTWFAPGDDVVVRAALGRDGIDFDPEPGSRAAAYAEKLAAHPTRFTLIQTGLGVAKVVVPLLLGALAVRWAVSLPWPDWSIPWPDWSLPNLPSLPSIPWPDLPDLPSLPSIPWPDWSVPGWVAWLLDKVTYVWPVLLAFLLARGELRRRRQQEERKAELRRPKVSLEKRPRDPTEDHRAG